MSNNSHHASQACHHWCYAAPLKVKTLSAAIATLIIGTVIPFGTAHAFEVKNDGDLRIRWDNTVKYTAAWRLKDADPEVANQRGAQPGTDFGNLGFKKGGLINNRFDILSELDVAYKDVGFRVSGAGWYDDVYADGRNDFPKVGHPANTIAAANGGANNRLPNTSRDVMGRDAELADAFVYGKFGIGDQMLSLRAGRHALIYGESLFLGANAIAAAQAPIDAVKALSLPNVQFKEVAMPVNQISGNLSLTDKVSIGSYLQFEWKEHRLPGVGSYFSPVDFVGPGSDLLIHPLAALNGNHSPYATRGRTYHGDDKGQWGLQVKIQHGDVDYGLYAAQYDDKGPIAVVNTPSIRDREGALEGGIYNLMYAKNIRVYGASASTVFNDVNVAAEISTRRNVPLVIPGDLILNTSVPNADNDGNAPYARGNSLHVNLSAISVHPANRLWDAASIVSELAFNRLLSVTHKPSQTFYESQNETHTRDALAMRAVLNMEYFQVLPRVDLQVPIGIGYGISGRSAVVSLSPEHGGDFSIGANATIDNSWKVGLNYTTYFGNAGTVTSKKPYASYDQAWKDRDFISFSIQRTF
ncbi:TPA: DUF1302 family protein [Pseudomonas aeruginosa]|nr:DUF1302 family protein [Pseudomonas aeruginosa]